MKIDTGKFIAQEAKENEVFLGNTDFASFPKPYMKELKTIRIGNIALDIKGEELPRDYRPLFINETEFYKYDKIMCDLMHN